MNWEEGVEFFKELRLIPSAIRLFFKRNSLKYLFIWLLQVLVVAHGI